MGNTTYETNKEKAEILAETFANISLDKSYNEKFLARKILFEATEKEQFSDSSNVEEQNNRMNEEFTLDELKNAINQTKEKSAPGDDLICYEMIKELPNESLKTLLKLYNKMWTEKKLPQEWKHAIILPFIKPQKIRRTQIHTDQYH